MRRTSVATSNSHSCRCSRQARGPDQIVEQRHPRFRTSLHDRQGVPRDALDGRLTRDDGSRTYDARVPAQVVCGVAPQLGTGLPQSADLRQRDLECGLAEEIAKQLAE
jgi:hypothetical protein